MSFFTTSTDKADVEASTSSYINASGMYPVTILAPIVSVSEKGSTSVDFFVEYNGQKQVIYGNVRLTNNDGKPNVIGSKLFNQLLVIAGLEEVSDPIEMDLPIGKGGKDKTAAVLEDLMDLEVNMRVQLEYSMFNNKIQERRNIRSFFRAEDNASAEEVISGENIGEGFERDMKYADNVTYSDGLDAAAIQTWISNNREGDGGASTETKKAPSFGKKRFGKDK